VGRGVQVQEDRSGPRDSAADVKRNNNGGCVKCFLRHEGIRISTQVWLAKPASTTFDIFGLGTRISLDPAAFGFTNVTNACGAVAGANCNTYEYWDGIHPTAAAHVVIANAFVAVASAPEPSTWVMLIIGFADIGFMAYRRSSKPALNAA